MSSTYCSLVASALVPASQRTPPASEYIARSTTICAGVEPMLSINIPNRLPIVSGKWTAGTTFERLLAVMRRDKKSRGALLRFVVLEGIGRPVRLEGPDETWLRDAFTAIST